MENKITVDEDLLNKLPEIENMTYTTSLDDGVNALFTSDFERAKEFEDESLAVVFLNRNGNIESNSFEFVVDNFKDGVAALQYLSGEKGAEIIEGVCTVIIDEEEKYLLIHHGERNTWELVKGRKDEGETLIETAGREIEEEVGLTNLEYVTRLPNKLNFTIVYNEEVIQKIYPVFVFRTDNHDIKLEDKFSDYSFLGFQEAIERITWKDQENAIITTEEYLQRV